MAFFFSSPEEVISVPFTALQAKCYVPDATALMQLYIKVKWKHTCPCVGRLCLLYLWINLEKAGTLEKLFWGTNVENVYDMLELPYWNEWLVVYSVAK